MSDKINYQPLFTEVEIKVITDKATEAAIKSIVKKAMEYQQAHDYQLAGRLASTETMLLDQLVDINEVEKAFNEFISL